MSAFQQKYKKLQDLITCKNIQNKGNQKRLDQVKLIKQDENTKIHIE